MNIFDFISLYWPAILIGTLSGTLVDISFKALAKYYRDINEPKSNNVKKKYWRL
jgi:hypothetical protein